MVALMSMVSASVTVLLASLQVAGTAAPEPEPVPSLLGSHLVQLAARQTGGSAFNSSSIPPACQSDCDPIIKSTNGCQSSSDVKCICNDNVADQFARCLNCEVSLSGSDNKDALTKIAQNTMDSFNQLCKSGGASVKSERITGNRNGAFAYRAEAYGVVGVALSLAAFLL
ncbi:hypothetical protein HGRIS_003555 [Hohenbuehelia grisea]|uniref:Extracellular membrane protein CFEM domain-containing protein n=1 Tax=Hohenbuehelia grisea TaxID=104357 RepID=A0ABR3JHI0_9AGAR